MLEFTPAKEPIQKKTKFEEDNEIVEVQRRDESDRSEPSSRSSQNGTPAMALTTQRLEEMTLEAPVRAGGTKTPLKMPPQQKRTRSNSATFSSETETEKSDDKEEMEIDTSGLSFEEMKEELRKLRKRQLEDQEITEKKLHDLDQALKDTIHMM